MNRRILNIAIPSIVSNITVPLLGLVDMAISGHMGDAVYIGAVAVGSMIFNVIYWLFGFLRMGTSGMTSQSLGRRDLDGVAMLLTRSMGVALLIGLTIVVFQYPIGRVALMLTGATADISSEAWVYFRICVWGAPAMLCLYGLTGWYIGMQNTRLPMFISILQNVVNIVASFTFVYVMGMKVEGVALGTLVAQYAGLVVSLLLWTYTYGNRLFGRICWRDVFEHSELSRFFTVNRDIFLRTLFMVAVNFYFLSAGASQGAVVLAVNTLLMQLFTLFSYVMDGFAYAGEALCGRLYVPAIVKDLHVWCADCLCGDWDCQRYTHLCTPLAAVRFSCCSPTMPVSLMRRHRMCRGRCSFRCAVWQPLFGTECSSASPQRAECSCHRQ